MFYKKNRSKIISFISTIVIAVMIVDSLIENTVMRLIILVLFLLGMFYFLGNIFNREIQQLTDKHQHEKTQIEQAYSLLKQQFETVITYLPNPMIVIDQYGGILLTNETFKLLLNDGADQFTIKSRSIPYALRKVLHDVYLSEQSLTTTIVLNSVDFQCISIPISQHERYQGCLVVLQDITKLVYQEKVQKRFVADASHELKTPITAIKGMVEILNREDFNDETAQKEFLVQIQREVERLQAIVKDLLYLSKLSNQTILLNKQPLDVHALVLEAVKTLKLKLDEKKIAITINHDDQEPLIADSSALLKIFINLIDNACSYSESDRIDILIKEDQQQKIITITDYGIGIEEEDLPHIFERFFRVDDARNRISGGSGLGLSIVKELVEAHHGAISVASQPNQHTTFTVTFPKLTKS
jgi:two-component system, OmpR family, phosphate regulon sensor histidine kinase PhoR